MNIYKKLRKEKNITQAELSKIMNVEQTTISKWECNRAIPDILVLNKLADYFDVTVDYLLGRKAQEKEPTNDNADSEENRQLIDELVKKVENCTDEQLEILNQFVDKFVKNK